MNTNAYNEKHFPFQRENSFFFSCGEPLNGFFYTYVRMVTVMVIFRDQYDQDPIVAKHVKKMHIRSTFK